MSDIKSCELGPYKGYSAYAYFEDGEFHGSILGVKAVLTFQAPLESLAEEFRATVDDYLDWCQQRGKEPEVPSVAEAHGKT